MEGNRGHLNIKKWLFSSIILLFLSVSSFKHCLVFGAYDHIAFVLVRIDPLMLHHANIKKGRTP